MCADFFDAIGNFDRGQRAASAKRGGVDFFDAIGNLDRGQRAAVVKRVCADFFDAIGNFDRGQRTASVKRGVVDFFNAIGNFDRGQRFAIGKRGGADFNDGETVDFRRNDDRSRAFVEEFDNNDAVVFDSRSEVARRVCGSCGIARGGVGRFVGKTFHFILLKCESRGVNEDKKGKRRGRGRAARVDAKNESGPTSRAAFKNNFIRNAY